MSTDASYRYERGVDPDGLRRAVERCVSIILATAGGRLDGPVLDCCPIAFEPAVVDLRMARIERLLGIPFTADEVTKLLTPLGFTIEGRSDGVLHVRVPGYRSYDVTREVDLIEEVARTHGYDAFPDDLGPFRPGSVPDDPLFRLCDDLRAALVARGLFEAHTPAFAPPGEGDVEVANPLAATEPFMRRSILPALLRRVEYNLARGNRDVRLFEIGTSFRSAGSGEAPHEDTHVAAVLTGRTRPPHWSRADEPIAVWDLKELLEDMARRIHGEGVTVAPDTGTADRFDADCMFTVSDGEGAVVGCGGRVDPSRLDLPAWAGEVFALEVTLPDEVAPRPVVSHRALPQYPATERDLALLVPESVPADSVAAAIRERAGDELEALELFDLYTGEGLAEGTRSLAFRLRFRSADRTLKDKDVDRSVNAVLERLEEGLGVKTRG